MPTVTHRYADCYGYSDNWKNWNALKFALLRYKKNKYVTVYYIYISPRGMYLYLGWYMGIFISVYVYISAKKRYSVTDLKISGLRVTLKVKKRYTVTLCIKNVYVFPVSCIACCPQTGDGWGRMWRGCGALLPNLLKIFMRICLLMWCTIHYVCNTLSHQTAGNMTTNAFKTISECNARGFTVDLQFMQNKIVRITITKQTKHSILLTSWTIRGLADLIDKAVGLWVADHSGALQGSHLTPVNKHIDPDLEKALS